MKKLFRKRKTGRLKAFSLAEVLIVLAIMGILIMLVVPNQTGIATRTKSMEAQQELRMVHNLQYAYYLQFSKYSMDLKELNYIPHKLQREGGSALYAITITEASPNSFKARAESTQDFNGDGKMNVWEIDQEGKPTEVQPD
jgi:type IV pilus assembly protein PilE